MTFSRVILANSASAIHFLRECTGQFLNLFGNLFLIWFISHRLEPEDFGLFCFWITVSTVLVYFYNCLHLLTLRHFSKHEQESSLVRLFSLHHDYLKICHISVIVVGLAGTIFCYVIGSTSNACMCLITTFHSLIAGLNIHYSGFQVAARLNWTNLYSRGLLPVARFMLILLSLCIFRNNLPALFLSYMLGTLVIVGYQHYVYQTYASRIIRNVDLDPQVSNQNQDWSAERESMWVYFLSLASMCFYGFIQNNGDKFILGIYLMPELMGVFSILNLTGFSLMFFMLGFITQSITPRIFARTSSDRQECMRNSFQHLSQNSLIFVCITIACSIFSYFTSSTIFELTLRAEYHQYASWHPWMVLAGGMYGVSQLLLIPAQILEQPEMQNNQRLITIIISLSLLIFSLICLDFNGILTSILIANFLTLLINGYFYLGILHKLNIKVQTITPDIYSRKAA